MCQNVTVQSTGQFTSETIVIEKVVLRAVTHTSEELSEYVYEASWSDDLVSSVIRTQQEVTELLSQLSKAFPDDGVENFLPKSKDPRCLTALPCHVLQHHSVQQFFTSTRPLSPNDLDCMVQYRGANRAVYRVASVQPVVSTHSSHSLSHPFSPHHLHPQSSSQSIAQSSAQSSAQLRLHKYYPVFKQLTMEEFLALTENDLNMYDLTQGAKKKLKTQLELQKTQLEIQKEMKLEKRPCSGIARVTPSSHMGPLTHPISPAGELRVEVDAVPHHHPVSTDSSSSSGYSSSSCSPRTPLCCDSSFDRTRDIHRRVLGPEAAGGGPEKERSCLFILNSSGHPGSSRPTAQVLPVQTDPAHLHRPSCSSHPALCPLQSPYHPQTSFPPPLLSSVSNPARILSSPRKPRPPPLCSDERTKPLGLPVSAAGFGGGVSVGRGMRLESLFPGLNMDGSSTLQNSLCRGLGGDSLGLMVETSAALTSTSNSLHHVSHPPLHFHLSSSTPPSPSGYYSYPPTSFSSSCSSAKSGISSSGCGTVPMATASSVPVAAVPGNTYFPSQSTCSPSPSPSSASSLDQNSGHTPSMCVCSSCGCRGNCGAYGALPGYAAAGYLQPFSAGPSLFTLGPLLHLSPLIASPSASISGGTAFSYPMMVPPPLYRHSPLSQDQQQGYGFYQPHVIVGGQKRAAGNMSCYNCGANGHRAEECKQPAMDSAQQGSFRLKYTPHSDSKDSGD
ncbi:Zinc finger CCHC domain containing protein 14 [Dissostichus eleginoides]|uniref:Zinc finger CCHC domain containing protein 14 n=1 Tax=Dissostichus eleginoides TaxID=100907 RepID=A0AAD9F4M9_DISEL|nr:Zinc finger CCHC domain containing protein 14 [Dissostichus eleginoides]